MGLFNRPPAAIRAAAVRVTRRQAQGLKKLSQPWQERALDYYDQIGAIHFSGQFYSRAFSKLRLFPAVLDETGEPQENDDKKVRDILDRVQDPNGGRSNLLGTYGRLAFLIGDSRLLMTVDENGFEQWEVVSPDELRVEQDGTYRRVVNPGADPITLKELPDEAFEAIEGTALVYRLWRRHPRYSNWADSSMRGVLDDCEEYMRLARTVRRRSLSRLQGPGIMWIPEEISFPPPEPGGDEDAGFDQFHEDLQEALTSPLADEETAAAMSPMLVRAASEYIEKVRLMTMRDATELYPEAGMRDECLRRIATGVDMPSEVILGLADSNHWSAWIVNQEVWTAHLQPAAQQLVDDFTSAYFRPACKDAGIANWERMVVGYDAAQVINHPNRGTDASDLYDRRAIGKAALRDAKGFDDTDAPTQAELMEMIGVAVRDPSLAVYGIPTIRGGSIEPTPGEIENAGGSNDDKSGPVTGADVEQAPPEEPSSVVASAAVDRIVGAAELAVERSREIAGARLRSRAIRSCEECGPLLANIAQRQVAFALGLDRTRELKAPAAEELVKDGASALVTTLIRWGYSQNVAGMIGQLVEQHAARTLFQEQPSALPAGFAGYVKRITREPLAA